MSEQFNMTMADSARTGGVEFKGGTYCDAHYPVVQWDSPEARDKNKWLFLAEIYVRAMHNYDVSMWHNYKGVITWNSLIYNRYKSQFNMKFITRLAHMSKYIFNEQTPFEEKIDGVVLVATYFEPTFYMDSKQQRYELCYMLSHSKKVGLYGKEPFPDKINHLWQGPCDSKLETVTKYKFGIAFENCNHYYCAYDLLAEKMLDCLCAKTIPIYLGAPNIQDMGVPRNIYIDFRDYNIQTLIGMNSNFYYIFLKLFFGKDENQNYS